MTVRAKSRRVQSRASSAGRGPLTPWGERVRRNIHRRTATLCLLVCLVLWLMFAILISQVLSALPLDYGGWKPVLIIAASWLSVIALGWPVNGWLERHMHSLASRIEEYRWRSVPLRGRVVPLEELTLYWPAFDATNPASEAHRASQVYVFSYRNHQVKGRRHERQG